MTNSWFKVLLKEIILSKNHIFSSYFIRFFISTWDKIQKSKWSKFVFFVRHQNSVVVPGHKITGRLSLTPFWYQLKWQLFLAMRIWTEMPVVTSVRMTLTVRALPGTVAWLPCGVINPWTPFFEAFVGYFFFDQSYFRFSVPHFSNNIDQKLDLALLKSTLKSFQACRS